MDFEISVKVHNNRMGIMSNVLWYKPTKTEEELEMERLKDLEEQQEKQIKRANDDGCNVINGTDTDNQNN